MSRLYRVTVNIVGYRPDRLSEIVRACCDEWDFEPDDFEFHIPGVTESVLVATAVDQLCGGVSEAELSELAERLVRGIWQANGRFCSVQVQATDLEYQPVSTYTYGLNASDLLINEPPASTIEKGFVDATTDQPAAT